MIRSPKFSFNALDLDRQRVMTDEISLKSIEIGKVLTLLLRDDILPPSGEKRIFGEHEAPEYVRTRDLPKYLEEGERDPSEPAPSAPEFFDSVSEFQSPSDNEADNLSLFRLEKELDVLFWDEALTTIVVEGETGCGKTTLLDYYFRCYCPNYPEPGRREKFDRKLTIVVDFRMVQTPDDVHRIFYDVARKQIEAAFRHIGMDVNFAHECDLYEPYFKWNSEAEFHERKAASRGESITDYRRGRCLAMSISSKDWCDLVFQFLERHNEYFEFFSLVFDNLDQSPFPVQAAAVGFALSEIRRKCGQMKFWKFFLPAWTSSLPTLYEVCAPYLSGMDTRNLYVPSINVEEFVRRRMNANTKRMTSRETRQFSDWAWQYVTVFFRETRRRNAPRNFFAFINNLSGANSRFRRDLVTATVANKPLIEKYPNEGFSKVGFRSLFDAFIKGQYRAHHRDKSQVANLFYASEVENDERALLIGMHLFFLLEKAKNDPLEETLRGSLLKLGHDDSQISEAISYFEKCKLIARTKNEGGKILIRKHAVRAYSYFIKRPEYLENMALVTPVTFSILQHVEEVGVEPADYFRRKRTTLAFLDCIRQVEQQYVDHYKELSEPAKESLRDIVQSKHLPGVFSFFSEAYKEQLRWDRRNGVPRLEAKQDRKEREGLWKSILENPIFSHPANQLLPAVLFQSPAIPSRPIQLEVLELRDIGGFHHLALSLAQASDGSGQWTVILGPNGIGKTTLLRGLALALRNVKHPAIWPKGAFAKPWQRVGETDAEMSAMDSSITVKLGDGVEHKTRLKFTESLSISQLPEQSQRGLFPLFAYGCRRGSALGGVTRQVNLIDDDGPEIATLFDEGADLIHAETWLLQLDGDAPKNPKSKVILDSVTGALKSLLGLISVEISDRAVWAREPDRPRIPFSALSDGYLTSAGWLLDLVARWLALAERYHQPIDQDFLRQMTGLVLIDEIDLHLHPRRQIEIIRKTRRLLPRMSFVVTTHNPLTLVGAKANEIWVLKKEKGRITAVQGVDTPMLLTGGQIYRRYFGIEDIYPAAIGRSLERYGFLSAYRMRNEEEQAELERLRAELRLAGLDPGWPVIERSEPRASEATPKGAGVGDQQEE